MNGCVDVGAGGGVALGWREGSEVLDTQISHNPFHLSLLFLLPVVSCSLSLPSVETVRHSGGVRASRSPGSLGAGVEAGLGLGLGVGAVPGTPSRGFKWERGGGLVGFWGEGR